MANQDQSEEQLASCLMQARGLKLDHFDSVHCPSSSCLMQARGLKLYFHEQNKLARRRASCRHVD